MKRGIPFSLCIEPVLQHMDFYDRIRAAADIGYDAVEFWNPSRVDLGRAAAVAAECGVTIAACCVHDHRKNHLASDGAATAIPPSLERLAGAGIRSAIVMAGDARPGGDGMRLLMAENLKRLRDAAERTGVCLLLEPLNTLVDHKGYALDHTDQALELIRIADSPCVKLLYDIYHMQIMEGNIIPTLRDAIGRIGHIHLAGVPSRHEPTSGELNMPRVLHELAALGYGGAVGMEYWPTLDTPRALRTELTALRPHAGG